MKLIISILILLAILAGSWYFFSTRSMPQNTPAAVVESGTTKTVVAPGAYTVDSAGSIVNWSAKKPLIEGYVNSGTIAVASGTIAVADASATGSFTLDMNHLTVGLTAKKPGKEGALETHLKSKDFFEVAKYPTATFVIKAVEPTASSTTDFVYTVRGDLTMKGKTNEITFPAHIYMEGGILHTHAEFEINRTTWGLTYGSGNFFKNLGDNLIADEVALSLKILATPATTPTESAAQPN